MKEETFMIRAMYVLVVCAVVGTWTVGSAIADDKETKVTGTLVCAKCGLKANGVKKCTNALQVKEGEKTVTYYLEDKGNGESYHEDVCGGGEVKNVTVTGKVSEKDGKKWIKPTKVATKK